MLILVHSGVVAVQKLTCRCVYLVSDNPQYIFGDVGGYYSVTDIGNLIKAGLNSIAPTAAPIKIISL